jgi:hypothetical protein
MLFTKCYEVSLGRVRANLRCTPILEVITMKKLVLAAALTAAASTAYAGSLADPVIEAPVIVEEATGSSSGILIPLILLAVVAAAVASD